MNIIIVHFRSAPRDSALGNTPIAATESAGTDGVSLEIAKRTAILEGLGHQVTVCSAYPWADLPLPELEFEDETAVTMMNDLFNAAARREADDERLALRFAEERQRLLELFRASFGPLEPDLIFVHNIFCLPVHPVATVALADWVGETDLPCAGIHHDILNEGAYQFAPTCPIAETLLAGSFPPRLPMIRHYTINSRNREALAKIGITAEVIHDTIDFDHDLDQHQRQRLRKELRERWEIGETEPVLLLSTRLVPNKQAEIAADLCAALEERKEEFIGYQLGAGGRVEATTRVWLVITGRPERAFLGYRDAFFDHCDELGITWRYVGEEVLPRRDPTGTRYSLYPDTYAVADFALYPTRWEGFGNQFLEIVASRLPVAVFEYPVFREDIAPLGFDYVSLGDESEAVAGSTWLWRLPESTLREAAGAIWACLTAPGPQGDSTGHNRDLAARHFGLPVLRDHLDSVLRWAEDAG